MNDIKLRLEALKLAAKLKLGNYRSLIEAAQEIETHIRLAALPEPDEHGEPGNQRTRYPLAFTDKQETKQDGED